jgi:phosphoribosylanthranilate isomerase
MTTRTKLRFIVKICGIANEEDARVAVEAGANALGFNFYPKSPRYVKAARARQIAAAVAGEFLKVGVFVNPTPDEVLEAASEVPLDVIQLHGDATAFSLAVPHSIWRSISPYQNIDAPAADAYLLDTPNGNFGGSGLTFDWSLAGGRPYPVIIAGGLDATNVGKAIETARPWGVDACSLLESSPGKKDPERVRTFIHAALAANLS